MFAYCNNNPVIHQDTGGAALETVWDVTSLCFSVVEVCLNPADPWAWLGLVGDIVDVAVPFVGGIGEITRTLGAADNAIDAAKNAYKTADAADDIRKAHGSYEIVYKSGKNYVGKGSYKRAINSAERYVNKYGDEVVSISWKSAPSNKAAFIDEYYRMQKRGVNNANTYNKIWSPGRKYYSRELHGLLS